MGDHDWQCWLQPGDPVVWLERPRGGYCEPRRILAQVVRLTEKRVRIELWRNLSGSAAEGGPYVREERSVSPEWLRQPNCSERGNITRIATLVRTQERSGFPDRSKEGA